MATPSSHPRTPPGASNGRTVGFITMALLAAALVFLAVRVADLILMVFASVLLAMLLVALAGPIQKRLHLGRIAALTLVIAVLLGLGGLMSWLLGAQLAAQVSSLTVLLPRSWRAFEGYLAHGVVGRALLDQVHSAKLPDNFMITWATRLVGNVAAAVGGAVIVLVGSIYLAYHPQTYRGGLLKLTPKPYRDRASVVLERSQRALSQWLVGQTISMVFIGLTTSAGLWLAGVPAPLALGVMAGIGHVVPVIGPWVTAAPGMLVAAAQGPQTLGAAFAIYMISSQIESNLLTPLILRRMSEVPMAVTLFAVVAMGMLLGPLGVLLATPLAVLAHVLVGTVYVEDLLGDRPDASAESRSSRPRIR